MSEAKRPAPPDWLIRHKDGYREVWLAGGCIDSVERLNEAEEFLRCMRPLLRAEKEDANAALRQQEEGQ